MVDLELKYEGKQDAWVTQSVKPVGLDLGVVSSSPACTSSHVGLHVERT